MNFSKQNIYKHANDVNEILKNMKKQILNQYQCNINQENFNQLITKPSNRKKRKTALKTVIAYITQNAYIK